MRDLLMIIAMLFIMQHTKAQGQWDEVNNIKLAGLYYTGEAYGAKRTEVYCSAMLSLVNKINAKQIERGERLITEDMIKGKEKAIQIPSEEGVRVFLYIPKKDINSLVNVVAQNSPAAPSTPTSTTTNTQSGTGSTVHGSETSNPQIKQDLEFAPTTVSGKRQSLISQLTKTEVFSSVEFILKQAKYDDPTLVYGKANKVGNTDDCYMIIVNKNMYVEAILSAKVNGKRTNLNTRQQQEKKDFPNCAVIYFK